MSEIARTVRAIVRGTARAALGTAMRDTGGAPYVSLVMVATDHVGAPLLLLSELADHTRNLRQDPRASLLFDATGERADPLAGERVTLMGMLEPSLQSQDRERYLAHHPSAGMYADFADFAVWRFAIQRAHLVAGFGRIHWLEGAEVMVEPAPPLREGEPSILAHLNGEHRDAVQLLARHLLGLEGGDWEVAGIDPEGCTLRRGGRSARLAFDQRVDDADGARSELVRLVQRARAAQ